MDKKRRIQWKRRRPKHYLTPSQMIERLADLQICALADCNTIWMPVDPHTCETLRSCCIGTLDGHQGAATQLSLALGLDPSYFSMAVRLSPEEAYFMHYVLGCLQVYCPAPAGMAAADGDVEMTDGSTAQQESASTAAAEVAQQHIRRTATDAPAAQPAGTQEEQHQHQEQQHEQQQQQEAAATSSGPDHTTAAEAQAGEQAAQHPAAEAAATEQAAEAPDAAPAQQQQQQQPPPALLQLDEETFWQWCCSCSTSGPAFPTQYIAYHHFRAKGWLPRSGLLYGCDYVLYQLHPAVVHSDYGALVVPLQGRQQMELSWQQLQIANRLISQVGKRLVLLYLHSDVPLEGELCSSPACLEHVTAEERVVARWVPDATRD